MTSTPKHNRKLSGRFIDDLGRVVMTSNGLTTLLSEGKPINGLLVEENSETTKYNFFSDNSLTLYTKELQEQTSEEYDIESTAKWTTPEEFTNINLEEWLLSRCSTDIQKKRVFKELNMYSERDLYPLLHHLIFLVEHFRKNNIVWGVGRGSSVASYVLFLIGIHKVDSIRYQLEIEEFLR